MVNQANTDQAIHYLKERLKSGELSVDEANVEMIRIERFRLISGPVRRDIRKSLSAGVKAGKLGHMRKDGLKPEVYYHPTFEYMAIAARNEAVRNGCEALMKVCV